MRKIIAYALMMMIVIIILPILIVRGCGANEKPENLEQPPKGIKMMVYISAEDKVVEMDMEQYIKGVVAAEMPADFELEALKAQAVAARTYAFGRLEKLYGAKDDRHKGGDICTDSTHCQAWISKEQAMKKWSFFTSRKNWKKIENAVNQTSDVVITYNGKITNPVFHSNSGGKTENAEDVWAGVVVPYLKSVPSEGEQDSTQYKNTEVLSNSDFIETLIDSYPDIDLNQKDILSSIKIDQHTEGGRVKKISIGNKSIDGTDFRNVFSLKSANFLLEDGGGGTIKITTYGYGHGVGMSQWGANYMAKRGGGYEEILKYYYTGVNLVTIDQLRSQQGYKG